MLVTVLLLGFVSVAAVTDIARHKIYNWTTYSGMLAALLLNVGGSILLLQTDVTGGQLKSWGWITPGNSLAGMLSCGFLVLVCFVIFSNIGGGDVKLMAMVGAFLGFDQGIVAMLWTFVLAACLALVVLIWRIGPWRLASMLFRRLLYAFRIYRLSPLSEEESKQLQSPLHLAPSAVAAVVIVRFSLIPVM